MQPAQINYEPLKGIDTAFKTALKNTLRGFKLIVSVLIFLFIIALGFLGAAGLIFNLLFAYVIAFLAYLAYQSKKLKTAAWLNFAAVNGWSVSTHFPSNFVPPSLQFGHSPDLSPVIAAEMDSLSFELAYYECTTGSGRYQVTHLFTLARLQLNMQLPHLILLSKKNAPDAQRDLVNGQELKLEGNFNDYFSLQIEKGAGVDVLTIITPDVMQTLLNYDQTEDIEFLGNNIYFISRNDKRDYKDMPVLIRSVVELGQQLMQNHRLASIQPSKGPEV